MIPFGFLQYLLRQTAVLTAEGVNTLVPTRTGAATKKRVLIIDSEVSFLKLIELPHGAKVTREFIELNYLHLSPFEGAEFCYVREKQNLLLWFYPAPEDRYLLVIPEGYLVWKGIARSRPNAIFACRMPKGLKLFVFRDGVLKAQFVKALFHDRTQTVEAAIEWLKKDSSLDDLDTVMIEDSIFIQGFKDMGLRNFLHFIRIELDRETLFVNTLNAAKWPLLILLSVYLATGYAMYWELKREITSVKGQLAEVQAANQPLKKRIEAQAGIHRLWESFRSSENVYPYFPDILDQAAHIISVQNGNIAYIRFAENRVSMSVIADNISMLIEQLIGLNCFEKVTVSGAVTRDDKTGKERAVIEGLIKKVTKDQLANP